MPRLCLVCLFVLAAPFLACSTAAPDLDAGTETPVSEEDAGPPPLPGCEDNSDCSGGEACREGLCRTVCAESDDCSGFYGQCDPDLQHCVECFNDAPCDADETCEEGLCKFHCRSDDHCAADEACDEESGACFEQECEENSDCQGGYLCTESRCVSIDPVICEADTLRCDGDVVVDCNGDGTDATRSDCAADERCVEDGDLAACLVLVCAPNEIGCSDAGGAFLCDATGTSRTEVPCNDNQYCQAGVCRNRQCEPSSATCSGDALVLCDALGSATESLLCDDTPACEDEAFGCACVDDGCVPRVCQPETSECAANGYRSCNDNGTGYAPLVACDESCAGGACVPSTCTAGEARCSGDTLLTCNGTGNGWIETSCGATGEACVESGDGASCAERACEPLSMVCSDDGRSVITCNGIGTASTTTACGADDYCEGGVCSPQVCEPGTRSCAGPASTQSCDAIGSELTVTACAAGKVCEDGACVAPSCTPACGERECGPDPVCGEPCGSCGGICNEDGECLAASDSGLEIVLTWDAAEGDLDLQLARDEEDGLCDADTCRYANCKANAGGYPEWDGNGTRSAGDPLLDIDDLVGYGPEVIVLAAPQNGTYYARVHAYTLPSALSTTATVVVRRDGQSIGTFTRLLTGEKDLWDGITISWGGNGATASDDGDVIANADCQGGGGGDAGVPDDGGTLVSCEHSGQCAGGEYCSWALFLGGSCASGCADDGDCSGSDVCNGAGVCVPASSNLAGVGASCSTDADCRWGYSCGYFFQTCQENCSPSGVAGGQRSCSGDPDCCPRTNAASCVDDALLGISATCRD